MLHVLFLPEARVPISVIYVMFKLLMTSVVAVGSLIILSSIRSLTQIGLNKERNLLACLSEKFRDPGT